MKKVIQWLKAVNKNATLRGKIIQTARERLADMDEFWRNLNTSNDDVAVLLMRIGLANIEASYQAQMGAQNVIRAGKARLN